MSQITNPVGVPQQGAYQMTAPMPGMSIGDMMDFLWRHSGRIVLTCLVAAAMFAAAVGWLWSIQPTNEVASQSLRFTFDGAQRGEYANGVPFSPKDLTAMPVLQEVFTAHELDRYLKPEEFASAVTIYDGGRGANLLQMEFQAKLSNSRLTQADRDKLEREYKTRLDGMMGRQYMLAADFTGSGVPRDLQARVVAAIPEVWARQSQQTKGVGTYTFAVPTGAALNIDESADYLVQAELLRATSQRLLATARKMAALPGAAMQRDPSGATIDDIIDEISSNYRVRVLPNYINFLRLAYASDAINVNEIFENRIEVQERALKLAESKAKAISEAFTNYMQLNAGMSPMGAGTDAQGGAPVTLGAGGQMPAIMNFGEGFFDRVIAQGIQSRDVEYRQQLNERQITAATAVLDEQDQLDFDKWTMERIKSASGDKPVDIKRVQADAKVTSEKLKQFSERLQPIYAKLSEINLNAPSQLYQADGAVSLVRERSMSVSRVGVAFVGTEAAAFVLALVMARGADQRTGRRKQAA
jgi:hypothetical protein